MMTMKMMMMINQDFNDEKDHAKIGNFTELRVLFSDIANFFLRD